MAYTIQILAIWLACGSALHGEALRMVHTSARLPSGRLVAPAVYDGDNSIYILGGLTGPLSSTDEIVRYSLDTDSIQVVARLRGVVGGGSAVRTGDNIVCFGGYIQDEDELVANISVFSPIANWVNPVGVLPLAITNTAAIWDHEDGVAYIIGGWGTTGYQDTIYKYNASSHQVELTATLLGEREFPSAVWDSTRRVAYIFGGYSGNYADILEYDPAAGKVSRLPSRLPYQVTDSCAVHVGQGLTYIVGDRGLIRFDHETRQAGEIQVEAWPGEMRYPGCTFVPKLNRIYITGGLRDPNDFVMSDLISYIELD